MSCLKVTKVGFMLRHAIFFLIMLTESILDFDASQKDYDRKLLRIEFSYFVDYDSYILSMQ